MLLAWELSQQGAEDVDVGGAVKVVREPGEEDPVGKGGSFQHVGQSSVVQGSAGEGVLGDQEAVVAGGGGQEDEEDVDQTPNEEEQEQKPVERTNE